MTAGSNPRRDFLRRIATGKSRSDPTESDPASEDAFSQHDPEPLVVRISRPAMACEFEICLPAGQEGADMEASLDALDLLDGLEEQMSVFRTSSEICEINRSAADGPVAVEPRLFELLSLAMRIHRETEGAYDITAGPIWEAWGFARRAGAIPTSEVLAEALDRVGAQYVELDPADRTVRFTRPGVTLNLGSIGKGYAVDRCAEHLLASGVGDFVIHGGNSSVLARGSRLGRRASESEKQTLGGWSIGIRDPRRTDRRLAEIQVIDRALGTSGAQFQSFRHQGRRYGHVLDPRTGWPADRVVSATVLAPSAALADALSTAFYVLGPDAAEAYCREHAEVAAVLVYRAAEGEGWEISRVGLSETEWKRLA